MTETFFIELAGLKYLFIDEFQDMNRSQYELVCLLAQKSSIFAIGDPDQAIYGFRGSKPEYFQFFIDKFGAETISLVRNYRSGPRILEAAGAVIANNHGMETIHAAKLIPENRTESGAIELYEAVSPQAEAEFVVQRIEELMGGISHFSIDSGRGGEKATERSFRDIAVLYRLTQQAEYLIEALERRGIPFQIINVKPFFMHREIRPLYYWIRAAAESGRDSIETEIYLQLLNAFPGVGKNTLELLENELPLGECTDFFDRAKEINIPKAAKGILDEILRNLSAFRAEIPDKGLSPAIESIMGFLRINPKIPEAKRIVELAGSFGNNLKEFAAYLRKNETATIYDEKAEAVTLMTIHGSKGLEFPVVFITGMEEGLFPGEMSWEKKEAAAGASAAPTSLHEERRLFYVGMTRARDSLILTSAATRLMFGSYRNRPASPFIKEIPASLYEREAQKKIRKKKTAARQMKLF